MTGGFRRALLRDLAWIVGLALVLGLLIGGSVIRLNGRKVRVASLQREIRTKRESLERHPASADHPESLRKAEAVWIEWQSMTASESGRIAELSALARAAGVTLVSLRSSDQEETDEGAIVCCSHTLKGLGSYRQLARFFDGIYAAPGAAAIEDLEIEPEDEAPSNLLRASLRVTWYAPGPIHESEDMPEAVE